MSLEPGAHAWRTEGRPWAAPQPAALSALCVTPALPACCAENHRDPHFSYLVHKVLDDLKMLFKTKEAQCFVFPGAPHVLGGALAAVVPQLTPHRTTQPPGRAPGRLG